MFRRVSILAVTVVVITTSLWSTAAADTSCDYVDSCTCDMSDGTGRVNLHSLALSGFLLNEAAFVIVGYDGWKYQYNPCNGFSPYWYYSSNDLAIGQSNVENTWGYDLGVHSSAYFNLTEGSGLTIHYTAFDYLRTSRILLICSPGTTSHTFEFVGELVVTEYDFLFTSPCACPGLCDDNGILGQEGATTKPPSGGGGGTTCDYVDSCTCDMSDGSGQVNLNSLSPNEMYMMDATFVIVGYDGWTYRYNPCIGFGPYWYWYSYDLAIAQTDAYNSYGYDLGVQTGSYFNMTEGSGISIHYTSYDYVRSSRVLLICEPGTSEHRFEYVGELAILEYDFVLTTPCACPGGCDNDGIIGGPVVTTKRTTTSQSNGNGGVDFPNNINVNVDDGQPVDDSSSLFWTDVGAMMIALIFHDLLLVIVIASVVVISERTGCCGGNQESENGQSTISNDYGIKTITDFFSSGSQEQNA